MDAQMQTDKCLAGDLHDSAVLVKSGDVVFRKVADETIFVPIRHHVSDLHCIYTTNELGSRIWELIDGERSLADIVAIVCREYDVTPEVAQVDLDEFAGQLIQAGCVNDNGSGSRVESE